MSKEHGWDEEKASRAVADFGLQKTLHKKMVLSNEKTSTNPPENVRQHVFSDGFVIG